MTKAISKLPKNAKVIDGKIIIDIQDWIAQYQEKEPNVSSEDEIIERSKEGVKPMELGRNIIVAREKGDTPLKIVGSNKILLNIGAATSVSRIIAKKMEITNLENGKDVRIRSYTCATEDSEIDAVVDSTTNQGLHNAINYLRNVVPGHIYSRLTIIAAVKGNGSVRQYAEEMKQKIDDMVVRLCK